MVLMAPGPRLVTLLGTHSVSLRPKCNSQAILPNRLHQGAQCILPRHHIWHRLPDEFVVTVVVFMVSEKVTEIDVLSETDVSPFEGVVDETFGKVIIAGS